ncbi:acyl-CoA dehydrogenase family protein, partial [Pseudomonas sp. EL_65y_Pfl2_R96]|uniref:acyl-CoA dehydrogenase family protein n=1 Tax=Pseudomonas sp. EL_65y_Pfl2_R96 TaxID=3088699 RepID=UPI0030D96447
MDAMASRGWTVPDWPTAYGGGGLSPAETKILREEMAAIKARNPLNSFGISMLGPALLKYGTEEQKLDSLPKLARGELRWGQGYSEPNAGSDLASLQTRAESDGEDFIINGQKIWTSRAEHSDLMVLLARTTPKEQAKKRTDGLSVFLVDMRAAKGNGLEIRPFRTMMNHATTEVFFT